MARPARVRPPLTPAQRERVAGWLPVVARTIRAAQRRHPWLRDEIESDAQWVLCLLAADVPDAGPALAVHAARQSILRTLQRSGRHMLLAPDDARADVRRRGGRPTMEHLVTPVPPGHGPLEAADWLAAHGAAALPRDLAALLLLHAGHNQHEVARRWGVDQSMVSHRCRRGLERLRVEAQAAETAEA
jgi:DNA-directed RNA polymerase specialized sigma24 family protein